MAEIHVTKEELDRGVVLTGNLADLDGSAGSLIGKGEGMTIVLPDEDDDGWVDFGECGYCGGRLVGQIGSLWGECSSCGAA